jgi:hypothetical protein
VKADDDADLLAPHPHPPREAWVRSIDTYGIRERTAGLSPMRYG